MTTRALCGAKEVACLHRNPSHPLYSLLYNILCSHTLQGPYLWKLYNPSDLKQGLNTLKGFAYYPPTDFRNPDLRYTTEGKPIIDDQVEEERKFLMDCIALGTEVKIQFFCQ